MEVKLNEFFDFYLGWCTFEQVEQMFIKFYKTSSTEMAKEFAEKVMLQKKNVSPAQIQGFFMFHKNDPNKIIDNVSQIWNLT